ncbi:putative nuclease HARBI1 [Merluccius polli]|uniref:Putative nuclease HARBI1 n=1 Tax=Merluccius polli TaxID=89951 RepID=A0AA47P816_MERPO|nr:putative nuclease HARBI1 [Merluccius polli]
MRNVMKKMVLPMAALALLEDLANGAIRRERVFREREDLLANDDNWLISRFRMCSITVRRIKYSSGEGYQTAHRCSISRQLSFPDNYLFERYHFTSQSIIYIHNLIRPYICNISNRSHALTSQQILCVALHLFANGSFLYNVRDAEHLSKATVCRAVRKVCLAMKRLLPMFVVFPGHKPVRAIKENDPVEEGAALLRGELHRPERVIRSRIDVLAFPEHFLFERYRFTSQSIIYIHNLIRPYISNITNRSHALTSQQILCVALRLFANRSFLHNVSDVEHLSKATVCRAVRKVCLALKRLLPICVVFPGHKPVRAIKEEFHRIAGFPSVIGCIDGTHIPITAPSHNEADYVNRKSIHSINVQFQHLSFSALSRSYVMLHTSFQMWRPSGLGLFTTPGFIKSLTSATDCNVESLMAFCWVTGYPCQPRLLTPYPDPEPGPQQNFNRAHCRTRARVEMTIGLLKARFQCLRHLRVTPDRACDIIVPCVVLHNIATIRGEQHPALQIDDADDDPIHLPAIQDEGTVRDTICNNHFRI